MEHLKQRFSKNSPRSSFLNDRPEDSQESFLAEDSDAFTGFRKSQTDADADTDSKSEKTDITLRLKLSDSLDDIHLAANGGRTDSVENEDLESNDKNIFCDEEPPNRGQTVFEVDSTEIIKEGRKGYVLYRILLRAGIIDEGPVCIQRRYSDFEKLHSKLRKRYPNIMDQVSFPKKHILGNFKPETIARRSRSFEQYLSHLYSLDTIRFCDLFKEFFYGQDLEEAYTLLSEGCYLKAITLFQKLMLAQARIVGDFSKDIGATTCAIMVCYLRLDEKEVALKQGFSALKCLRTDEKSVLFLSLLNSCIHLCWLLGKDRDQLEKKLSELVTEEADVIPDLIDVVLKQRGS